MPKESIKRIDLDAGLKKKVLPLCRLKPGEIWTDPKNGHKIGCLDISNKNQIDELMDKKLSVLSVQDPPYNIKIGKSFSDNLHKNPLEKYIDWSKQWVSNVDSILKQNAHFYVWLGADQMEAFQPLPDFMIMMRQFPQLKSRSFLTMRNQRGYGTQKNWMAIRQELLYYVKGKPKFNIEAEYTDIPKILKGYYKVVNGNLTSNMERSKSDTIRAGNVWVDIQQVFFLMHENVPGCYAQKPIKAIERIVKASSDEKDIVVDFFAHSGSTLMACEINKRKCYTLDNDPIFAEIAIRRLERFRKTGELGWQTSSPFPEI